MWRQGPWRQGTTPCMAYVMVFYYCWLVFMFLSSVSSTVQLVDDWTTQKIDLITRFDGPSGRKF